jgi:hypothetical protein
MVRLGGLVLLIFGGVAATLGVAMALAVLGRPVPTGQWIDWMRPFLDRIALKAALPAGSDVGALVLRGWGQVAVAAIGAGALIALGGLRQMVTGRRSVVFLILIAAIIMGFALAGALAPSEAF